MTTEPINANQSTVINLSFCLDKLWLWHPLQPALTMLMKANFFRLLAIPACLLWGIWELISLQRARLLTRR